MTNTVIYPGKDLEAMSFAANYHRWILSEFTSYLGRRVVEVGAGTGGFTRLLVEFGPEKLAAVEPSGMFMKLEASIGRKTTDTDLFFFHSTFSDCRKELSESMRPDTIIYVNVLEHIENDLLELKLIYDTLDSGGRALIFVPALQGLYSKFDKEVGHFRRYSKHELDEKVTSAGFTILKSKYFDFFGIVPWWITQKLLEVERLSPFAVNAYDKLAVPLVSRIENLITPMVGKNLLLVCEKG